MKIETIFIVKNGINEATIKMISKMQWRRSQHQVFMYKKMSQESCILNSF